jgi:hypothetical protein
MFFVFNPDYFASKSQILNINLLVSYQSLYFKGSTVNLMDRDLIRHEKTGLHS